MLRCDSCGKDLDYEIAYAEWDDGGVKLAKRRESD